VLFATLPARWCHSIRTKAAQLLGQDLTEMIVSQFSQQQIEELLLAAQCACTYIPRFALREEQINRRTKCPLGLLHDLGVLLEFCNAIHGSSPVASLEALTNHAALKLAIHPDRAGTPGVCDSLCKMGTVRYVPPVGSDGLHSPDCRRFSCTSHVQEILLEDKCCDCNR